ncbi:MAG TPA: phage holin family protein [Pseudomonadales bacterium]|nr:phage holin family protein [Pseudomonadales bacterium]
MFILQSPFLLHWLIMSLSLWAASHIFRGIRFTSVSALAVSALILGFVNAILKPLLVLLTLPLTVVTFGIFLLVINALMIMLVSSLVRGFKVSSFWTAFFVAIFLSVFSYLLSIVLVGHPVGRLPSGWI